MSDQNQDPASAGQAPPRAPLFLDDLFLLLVAGMIIPSVIYLGWGLVSLLQTPPFPR